MSRQGIGLIMPSVLVCGLILEIRAGLNNNDTLLNWYEAHHYCQSLNLSLVDPYVDKISMNGTFWTNRHLANYSSWIYVKGCVRTSPSFNGRLVSSIWQCDNLCKLSRFFGIQNFSCICLDVDDNEELVNNAVKRSCTEKCSTYNLMAKSPLKYCGESDFITVYGTLKEVYAMNPTNGNCIALTCKSGTKEFIPSVCDNKYDCVCGDGDNNTLYNEITRRNWKDCFQFCKAKTETFMSTTSNCNNLGAFKPFISPAWIAVARNPNVQTRLNTTDSPDCYSCENTTLQCQYESCFRKYLPLCQQQINNTIATDEIPQGIYSTPVTTVDHGNFSLTDRQNSINETVTMHSIYHGTTSLNKDMTTTGRISHNTDQSKNDTDLQILVPVGVAVVAIATCLVVFLTYRYRKRKGKPNNRFVQVHFQNEYVDVVKSCTREENRRNETAANASQDDPAYIDCKMDVYDHLGEKHLRHLEQSEYLYSHTGSSDSQYGDVSVAPSDDTYDHTKAFNTSNAEYDSCTRY